MDSLGPSLKSLFNQNNNGKFSLKTVLMLADQMLSRIEYIHKQFVVHRNIQPDNFCIGLDKLAKKIFIIDFGSAKTTKQNITWGCQRILKNTGSPHYSSFHIDAGIEASLRDDMESLGYILIYFLRGRLPWQGLRVFDQQEKLKRIKEKKLGASIQQLCKGLPIQFSKYMTMTRLLSIDDVPNYSEMRKMFKDLFERSGYKFGYRYDWVQMAEKKIEQKEKEEKEIIKISHSQI